MIHTELSLTNRRSSSRRYGRAGWQGSLYPLRTSALRAFLWRRPRAPLAPAACPGGENNVAKTGSLRFAEELLIGAKLSEYTGAIAPHYVFAQSFWNGFVWETETPLHSFSDNSSVSGQKRVDCIGFAIGGGDGPGPAITGGFSSINFRQK